MASIMASTLWAQSASVFGLGHYAENGLGAALAQQHAAAVAKALFLGGYGGGVTAPSARVPSLSSTTTFLSTCG